MTTYQTSLLLIVETKRRGLSMVKSEAQPCHDMTHDRWALPSYGPFLNVPGLVTPVIVKYLPRKVCMIANAIYLRHLCRDTRDIISNIMLREVLAVRTYVNG